MSENETPEVGAQEEQQPQVNFALQRIYVKDISFESPNSPMVFQKQWKPEVKMDLNTKNAGLGEDHYEVVVSATFTVSVEGMTAYIVEVQQAGIFKLEG
ncbi:protein-export chaperone SecB, partial [Oleiphilus sp. HI0128]